MKNCKTIEKKLLAYLHGELGERDRLSVQVHLDGCSACAAALEAQRAALELLGSALETAPAPERLREHRTIPQRESTPRTTFADYWFSPQFKATCIASVVAVFVVVAGMFFSTSLVVFKCASAPPVCFEPPPLVEAPRMQLAKVIIPEDPSFSARKVKRPVMPMKELRLAEGTSRSKLKPRLRKRIVSNSRASEGYEIKMPEVAGVNGGLGNMGGNSLGSIGFDLPAPSVQVPKMPLKKLSVKMKKPTKPQSTAKITAAAPKPGLNDIQFPDLDSSGIGAGLAGPSETVDFSDGDGCLDSFGDTTDGMDDVLSRGIITSKSGNEARKTRTSQVEIEAKFIELSAEEMEELGFDRKPLDALVSVSGLVKADKEPISARLKERKAAEFNPYVLAAENAFSTFSIDVDTAAYGLARRQLLSGGLPVPETVRTEEFINSFDYDYRPPAGKQTFAVHSEMAPSPFRPGMELLKTGIKGYRIGRDDHRGAVLTLVIDTSGSMATPERMGLVKKSLALLLNELGPADEVALVQFGGEARLVLEHTPVAQKEVLLKAVEKLQPGGPTQFDSGLELGYAMATTGFKAGASNRIIVMSDGVANLGELDPEAMLEKVGEHRRKGIYLSVLGFGAGTYDDDLLERLANRGDGMYAYVDTLGEARNLFVDRLAATLHVIASDVKIQIEFNPDRVLRYRQLGYENRQLTQEQFRDDTVDAGEVGSGQSVTALYDVELNPAGDSRDPIATVYVRYRRTDTGEVEEISHRVMDAVRHKRFADAPPRFRVAACAAEFAECLRRSPYSDATQMQDVLKALEPVVLELELDSQVRELLQLISIANGLGK